MKKRFIFLFIIAAAAAALVYFYQNKVVQQEARPDKIPQIIDSMTLEEKVGQMLVVGFWGEDASYAADMIQTYNVSGVILMKYNMGDRQQLIKLINDMQSISKYPLFISADQEGGLVTKVQVEGVKEFTAQSGIKSAEQAYQVAFDRGKELKELGFNINFSPMLDYITDKNSFLYSRAFRGSLDDFGEFGKQMVSGYQDAGISATVKHFPGHANDSIDSHENLPAINWTKVEFDENIPQFKKALEADPDLVMVGHIKYPNIDPDNPASLSPIIIQDILRGQLNYQGIIITDDMEMGALMENYSVKDAAIKAVQAGCDLLLYVSTKENQVKAYKVILEAVRRGEIEEWRIDESVRRIFERKFLISN
ncbi:MAG: glycoside hydrolase family 3 protein [Patescibacteria group bacterium]